MDELKTAKGKAPVPVIAALGKYLDGHRPASGYPASGLIFFCEVGFC